MADTHIHQQTSGHGTDAGSPSRSELHALELRIAELTGVAEFLAQKISLSQGHIERLERDIEDSRRLKAQAEAELQAQEEIHSTRRRAVQKLEAEIERHESTINNQQERIRTLAETIDIADKRSKQVIDSIQAETNDKLKVLQQEFEAERERIRITLEVQRNETQAEIRQFTEDLHAARKKQLRALEIETQAAKKRADEDLAKMNLESRQRAEGLIRAAETTAQELTRESEASARRLLAEANQKATDLIRAAQLEAEDVRRRSHHAEVNFLKEKNQGLADMKLFLSKAKDDAQATITEAMRVATDTRYAVEKENELKIAQTNQKIMQMTKAAEGEAQEHLEKVRAELFRLTQKQETDLAQKKRENEEAIAHERQRAEEEVRTILTSARDLAQSIIEAANQEKSYKFEELKATEASLVQSARQLADGLTQEAETTALKLVDEARLRAASVDKQIESIVLRAQEQANAIQATADAYCERVKREVPDPALWESELARMRREEQERLKALIDPTVKNYLKAIDMAISDIFVQLPTKYHSNKVIQDFANAIAGIQHRKNLVNFAELVPKLASQKVPTSASQTSMKKSS